MRTKMNFIILITKNNNCKKKLVDFKGVAKRQLNESKVWFGHQIFGGRTSSAVKPLSREFFN